MTNKFGESITSAAAKEGETVTIPDIRLQPGGWISGRVEYPPELKSNADMIVTIKPKIQGDWPTDEVIPYVFRGEGGRFRIRYVPGGVYTLDASVQTNGSWHSQGVGSVSNITVVAGQDTTNVFIPTKMIVHTNSPRGR